MRLAVYNLVGALFAPADWTPLRHADKLFRRVRAVITDGFADPDLAPFEVAARAGISLRYLQKLFTQRGSTCSEFIHSLRLDNAERLLHLVRESSLGAAVLLAHDQVYDAEGKVMAGTGSFYVPNDYVLELARKHPEFLPAVSIHPNRCNRECGA